jgi:hypothetical protein
MVIVSGATVIFPPLSNKECKASMLSVYAADNYLRASIPFTESKICMVLLNDDDTYLLLRPAADLSAGQLRSNVCPRQSMAIRDYSCQLGSVASYFEMLKNKFCYLFY